MEVGLAVAGSRTAFAERIIEIRGDLPITPLVVSVGFVNPNLLLQDLTSILQQNAEAFEHLRTLENVAFPIVVLLVAHTSLDVPQVSSWLRLPDWMPRIGGTEVSVSIEDISGSLAGPLNSPEAHIGDVSRLLYELECALSKRLLMVYRARRDALSSFFDSIKRTDDLPLGAYLEACAAYCAAVVDPGNHRPSTRDRRSLLGRLVETFNRTSPDSLNTTGRSLGVALAPSEATAPAETVVGVLLRSVNIDSRRETILGRRIYSSVYAAYQFTTAAHHAAEYPHYPIALIGSLSHDLRRSLTDLIEHIEGLPAV